MNQPGQPHALPGSGVTIALMLLILGLLYAPLATAQKENEAPPPENSAREIEPEEVPRYRSRRERDRQLLAERFPDDVRWLELPTPEAKALALFRPADATPKGALLLLYGADHPPHWPAHLDNLRRALPRHGWATLALTLPLPERAPIPERPEEEMSAPAAGDDDPAEEKENEDTAEADQGEPEDPLPPRAERIASHLDAALAWLAREGQGNLVVLVDAASATPVLEHLRPQLETGAEGDPPNRGESPMSGPIRALILVNSDASTTLTTDQLEQIFAVPELPVLDIFLGPAARLRERTRQHRDISRRQRLEHYQSLALTTPTIQDPENERSFWVRRLQGFMHRQAEGVEVRRARNDTPAPQAE